MDLTSITTLISSVGFPIACCCFCGYYISTTMKEFTKTIENNTIAIKELVLMLGKDYDDEKRN